MPNSNFAINKLALSNKQLFSLLNHTESFLQTCNIFNNNFIIQNRKQFMQMNEEQQLIADFKKGKRHAQKMIFELHAPAMMAVCVRYVGNKELARDLLQDGFIRVFEHAESYSGKGPLGAWIRRIIVNTILEYFRKNDALKMSVDLEEYQEQPNTYEPDILSKISTDEILKCIDELPTGFRTVFNLFAIEDFSHAEIAAQLNISESTSRSQYMRARNMLQKKILSLNSTKV